MNKSDRERTEIGEGFDLFFGRTDGHLNGCVVAPQGIVYVYGDNGSSMFSYTRLFFTWDGGFYQRELSHHGRHSRQEIIDLAVEYANDVVEKQARERTGE